MSSREIIKPIRREVQVKQLARSDVDFSTWILGGAMMSLPRRKLTLPSLCVTYRKNSNVFKMSLVIFHDLMPLLYLFSHFSLYSVLQWSCTTWFLQRSGWFITDTNDVWCNAWDLVFNRPRFKAWLPQWIMKLSWASFLKNPECQLHCHSNEDKDTYLRAHWENWSEIMSLQFLVKSLDHSRPYPTYSSPGLLLVIFQSLPQKSFPW